METTNGLSLPENLPAVQAYFNYIFHIPTRGPYKPQAWSLLDEHDMAFCQIPQMSRHNAFSLK